MSEFVRAAREMSGELFTSRDPRRCSAPKSLTVSDLDSNVSRKEMS